MYPRLMFDLYAAELPNESRAVIARQTRAVYAALRAQYRKVGR